MGRLVRYHSVNNNNNSRSNTVLCKYVRLSYEIKLFWFNVGRQVFVGLQGKQYRLRA
jgi:hypothetical protein